MAQADLAFRFVTMAVRAYGDRVLAGAEGLDEASAEVAGRELARLIFGTAGAGTGIPVPLAELVERPGSERAFAAVDVRIEELLGSDAGLAAAVAEVLGRYYRRQLESGDGEALAELGDLLWREEPDLARTAFERAAGAGNDGALIRLAEHRWVVLRDYDGAVALYQQAIASPDPDIAAGALTGLGEALGARGDHQGAREAWERCIAAGSPDWAPQAMTRIAGMLEQDGDRDGAVAMYRAAFGTGHPEVAPRAMLLAGVLLERSGDDDGAEDAYQRAADAAPPGRKGNALCQLADLLHKRGDTARAKALWQQVIDTQTDEGTPGFAWCQLVSQLGREGDLGGLRAAWQAGIARGLWDAPNALVEIGQVLRDRGDLEGWRDAWQQAIDAGYQGADDLREELSPPADDEDDEPAELPAEYDPRNMARNGIAVLENGLPPLPEELTRHMAVPMAYWAGAARAVVLFLGFHRFRRVWEPSAIRVTFTRQDGEWMAQGPHWHGGGFHDPFTDPGGLHGLGGEAISFSGSSGGDGGTILHGTAAPPVKYLTVIQDGHQDRRPLDNHYGAWVIRTDKPGPFRVAALDHNGTTLAEIEYPPRFARH